ncbi:hypothetical protein [Microseira wollei]|uniref:Serine/threonine protein kinase, putative n=1 Tax=Microseira wollei NIES-4236 TaxID=2530354 RepID=A0AAV3XFT0_9CYAN|nr:hypothetical protein [Microseira wollei]GET40291.1 serine/threonine protein kinase, putative [Microseira wollei NIES-4236]
MGWASCLPLSFFLERSNRNISTLNLPGYVSPVIYFLSLGVVTLQEKLDLVNQMTPTLLNNRYKIIRALATGGFGHTFLAEDTYLPSRHHCVIKQLKPVSNHPLVTEVVIAAKIYYTPIEHPVGARHQ